MDISADVPFYYDTYRHLHGIARNSAGRYFDDGLIGLAMYIENNANVGLDPLYESMYRSIGDAVSRWCKAADISPRDRSRIYAYVTDAVADAPAGSLRQWIAGSVLSHDFNRLSDVALFFACHDAALSLIYPAPEFRKGLYLELTHNDRDTAQKMLWSDMAFNWRDKTGKPLLHRLADMFRRPADDEGIASALLTVGSMRLDAYLPLKRNDNRTLTLINKSGRIHDVVLPAPLPDDFKNRCFVSQLASYLGTTYVNGPGLWLDMETYYNWNGNLLWSGIEKREQEYANNRYFMTSYGKRHSLYNDLYLNKDNEGIPADLDEPDIFDFLNWLTPKERGKEKLKQNCQ